MTEAASKQDFSAVATKMRSAGMPDLAVRTFQYYLKELVDGQSGLLGESLIAPVTDAPRLADWAGQYETGRQALAQTVVFKLNGGLGTSMGLNKAKSLLPVRENASFLELIARQVLHLRRSGAKPVPLLLMDSFSTAADAVEHLARWPELAAAQAPLPLSFLQHQVPRLRADTLALVDWPADPQREWCPPGHGDLYTVLHASGLLKKLIEHGYRYAFVSNADNLGGTLDLDILGQFAAHDIPFLMEVTERTPADRKGGHLAQTRDGKLVLREAAQAPPDEQALFQDIERYRFFNTNNLWLNLPALARELEARDGILGLPMIRNLKHVVPEDAGTPQVVQIETAMGAAIEVLRAHRSSMSRASASPRSRPPPTCWRCGRTATASSPTAAWSPARKSRSVSNSTRAISRPLPDSRIAFQPARRRLPMPNCSRWKAISCSRAMWSYKVEFDW